MYIRCNECEWSQDDFWQKGGYNPLRYMMDWEDQLIDKFSVPFDGELDTKGMTYGQVIARDMVNGAKQILKQKWATIEDFKKAKENGTAICPKCGSKQFIED